MKFTHVQGTGFGHVDYRVVVQHFRFETWALGNRVIGSKNPQNETLRRYRQLYTCDPVIQKVFPRSTRNG